MSGLRYGHGSIRFCVPETLTLRPATEYMTVLEFPAIPASVVAVSVPVKRLVEPRALFNHGGQCEVLAANGD